MKTNQCFARRAMFAALISATSSLVSAQELSAVAPESPDPDVVKLEPLDVSGMRESDSYAAALAPGASKPVIRCAEASGNSSPGWARFAGSHCSSSA